jgi:hypothetical protein
MTIHMKRDLLQGKARGSLYAAEIKAIRKLCLQSVLFILRRIIVNAIGQHTKNFAAVQNQIAIMVKNFVLAVTGNSEISKDTLSKQHNYICVNESSIGLPFLRRILKQVDLAASVEAIEDRFLPDKDLILLLLQSLQKGQKVQLQKIKAVEPKPS